MKIVIDFDGTITDTSASLLNMWNNRHGTNITTNLSKVGWEFDNLLHEGKPTKEEYNELLSYFGDENQYDYVVLQPNAIRIINFLAERHEVIIATRQGEFRREITREFVETYMPNVKLLFCDSFDKGVYFEEGEVDIFVDDRLDACYSMDIKANNIITFGKYQWNKMNEEWCSKMFNSRTWSFTRVNNWMEILLFVMNYCIKNNIDI